MLQPPSQKNFHSQRESRHSPTPPEPPRSQPRWKWPAERAGRRVPTFSQRVQYYWRCPFRSRLSLGCGWQQHGGAQYGPLRHTAAPISHTCTQTPHYGVQFYNRTTLAGLQMREPFLSLSIRMPLLKFKILISKKGIPRFPSFLLRLRKERNHACWKKKLFVFLRTPHFARMVTADIGGGT